MRVNTYKCLAEVGLNFTRFRSIIQGAKFKKEFLLAFSENLPKIFFRHISVRFIITDILRIDLFFEVLLICIKMYLKFKFLKALYI